MKQIEEIYIELSKYDFDVKWIAIVFLGILLTGALSFLLSSFLSIAQKENINNNKEGLVKVLTKEETENYRSENFDEVLIAMGVVGMVFMLIMLIFTHALKEEKTVSIKDYDIATYIKNDPNKKFVYNMCEKFNVSLEQKIDIETLYDCLIDNEALVNKYLNKLENGDTIYSLNKNFTQFIEERMKEKNMPLKIMPLDLTKKIYPRDSNLSVQDLTSTYKVINNGHKRCGVKYVAYTYNVNKEDYQPVSITKEK